MSVPAQSFKNTKPHFIQYLTCTYTILSHAQVRLFQPKRLSPRALSGPGGWGVCDSLECLSSNARGYLNPTDILDRRGYTGPASLAPQLIRLRIKYKRRTLDYRSLPSSNFNPIRWGEHHINYETSHTSPVQHDPMRILDWSHSIVQPCLISLVKFQENFTSLLWSPAFCNTVSTQDSVFAMQGCQDARNESRWCFLNCFPNSAISLKLGGLQMGLN